MCPTQASEKTGLAQRIVVSASRKMHAHPLNRLFFVFGALQGTTWHLQFAAPKLLAESEVMKRAIGAYT